MRTALKAVLYALAGLALLVVAAAIALLLLVKPNDYKPEIERIAKDATGRTLRLEGDLGLAFYPSLGLTLGKTTLSERASERTFVALDSATVAVALVPLLRREIVVDEVRLRGLRAQLVRGKDGRLNIDDLLARGAPAAKPAAPPQAAPGGPSVRVDISGVRVERASLGYRDERSGQEIAVENLELRTGRIASGTPGALRVRAALKGRNPALDLKTELSSDYRFNLDKGDYALDRLEAKVNGSAAGLTGLALALKGNVQGSPQRVTVQGLTVEFESGAGDAAPKTGPIKATLKAALRADLNARIYEAPELGGSVSASHPLLAQQTLTVPFKGALRADLAKENIGAEIAATLDDTNLQAKLGMTNLAAPRYSFDVGIDRIDLDRYFPPAKKEAAAKAPAAKPEAQDATPVDLSPLRGYNATGRIRLADLTAQRVKLSQLDLPLKLANGRLEAGPHSARLYGGSVSGALALDAEGNRIALREELRGVALGELVRDLLGRDAIEGGGEAALDVAASGATLGALKRSLSGSARVALKDGALKGINLAETLRKTRSAFGSKSAAEQAADRSAKTEFGDLSASFVIRNGVAHNEDLLARSPLFRVTGTGDIDIGNSRIDYAVKVAVSGTAKEPAADLSHVAGLTVPLRVSGPFDALKYEIQYRAMVGETLKTRIQEKLRGGEGAAPSADRVKEKLRGLLKR